MNLFFHNNGPLHKITSFNKEKSVVLFISIITNFLHIKNHLNNKYLLFFSFIIHIVCVAHVLILYQNNHEFFVIVIDKKKFFYNLPLSINFRNAITNVVEISVIWQMHSSTIYFITFIVSIL